MFLRLYAHSGKQLPQSFEAMVDAMSNWPGMFVEMDGSFVWSILEPGSRRQIDGMIYDRNGAIEYVELKGDLTADAWHRLLETLLGRRIEPDAWDRELRVHDVAGQTWRLPSRTLAHLQRGSATDGD